MVQIQAGLESAGNRPRYRLLRPCDSTHKPLVVPDALKDGRFVNNALVKRSPHIRFYAGFPLATAQGLALGTLCAIDRKPHELSAQQAKAMKALARQVMALLELRRTSAHLAQALKKIRTLHGLLPICAWCKRIRDDEGYWKRVEMYIQDHSEASFTHGICPECLSKVMPQSKSGASDVSRPEA